MKYTGLTVILFLLGCGNPASTPSHPAPDTAAPLPSTPTVATSLDSTTLGGTWYLQPVLASDTAAGKTPWLEFNLVRSRFNGNTGCNMMRGKFWYSNTDSSLSFGQRIQYSKISCPGYNEAAFLKSLNNTAHFRLQNGVLILTGDAHDELSRWTRHPTKPARALKA